MPIRHATSDDILRIVGMIEDLRDAVGGPIPVDRAHTAATVARLIASPDGLVMVSPGGFIAAALVQTVINPAPVAQEIGWLAGDGSGLRLLRAFESWAAERGARWINLSTGAAGPDLARIGYRRAEMAWVKEI